LSGDVGGSQFDVGTMLSGSVRVGDDVQILCSSSLEAKLLYRALFEKYKRPEERLKGR
jgi:hypothetical protein